MTIETLRAAVAPLLNADLSIRANLQRLREALRNPAQRIVDRPWLVNRYTRTEVAGIEVLWEEVAQALVRLLERPEPIYQQTGLLMLLYAPAPSAARAVVPLIDHPEPAIAVLAINLLAEMRFSDAVPRLVSLLDDPRKELRAAAAAALGVLGNERHVPALRARMEGDPAVEVQVWAGQSLGEIGGPEALAALLAALPSDTLHPLVWMAVRRGLWRLGSLAVDELLEGARSDDVIIATRSLEAVAHLDDARIDTSLLATMRTGGDMVGIAAAWSLMERGNPRGKAHLAVKLSEGDAPTRVAAAGRLASQGVHTGLTHLLEAYFEPDLRVGVHWMVAALPPERRAAVAALVDDPSPRVARAALDLIGVLNGLDQLARLEALVESGDTVSAFIAAVSLARLGVPSATQALVRVLARAPKARERAEVAGLARQLWRPLPVALAEVLLEDASAEVVLLGVEALLASDAPDPVIRLGELLAREVSRQAGALAPYQPKQNKLKAALMAEQGRRFESVYTAPPGDTSPEASQPVQTEEDPPCVDSGWDNPSVVVSRAALAALFAAPEAPPREPLLQALRSPVSVVRYRALQTLLRRAGREALEEAPPALAQDPDLSVRDLYERARRSS